MPYFYDLNRQTTSSGSAGTEVTHVWAQTIANQETLAIYGVYAASRFLTAGGGQINVKTNTSAAAVSGVTQTASPRNLRGSVAAQSVWKNDISVITAGLTLTTRITIGFAQTGGMGGWVPIVPGDAVQLMPNATNPVDIEFTSNMASNSVTFGLTVELGEGI